MFWINILTLFLKPARISAKIGLEFTKMRKDSPIAPMMPLFELLCQP